jgi:MFS family permease
MLIAMAIMFVGYSLTWGPVNWVLLGEIVPLRVRGAGMGMASMVTWLATLGITFGFPLMNEALGLNGTMMVFVVCNIIGFIFCLTFVPETRGRSLEEIEQDMLDKDTIKHGGTITRAVEAQSE